MKEEIARLIEFEEEQLRDTLCNTLASNREAVCRYYKLKL